MKTRAFVIGDVVSNSDAYQCTAGVPDDLVFFDGHFDDQPVLPGIAQLEALIATQAREAWPELGRVLLVSRLKFRRVVLPGEHLSVRLKRSQPSKLSFELLVGEEPCCSGNLTFEVNAS